MRKEIEYPNVIFKQKYLIDENGKIYSPWRGLHEMYQNTNKQGYKELYLYTENGRKCFKVHRLVMTTFKPTEQDISLLQVNHIDGNKSNNNVNNLEWCTRQENMQHAFNTGLAKKINSKGENNNSHKLTEKKVYEICEILLKKDRTLQEIADQYGVTKGCISHIKLKKSWKDITEKYNFD